MLASNNNIRRRKARVPEGCSRSFYNEKEVIKNLIGDFNINGSKGANLIEKVMGGSINDISQHNIISLACVIDLYIKRNFSRNHKRSKSLAIKWFDENYDIIYRILPNLKLQFGD